MAVNPAIASVVGAFLVILLIAWLSWRYPDIALVSLVPLVALQNSILGYLLVWGVPVPALQVGRSVKDVVLGVVLLRLLESGGLRSKWGWLDKIAFACLLMLCVYAILPGVAPLGARIAAARQDSTFLLVFILARHLPLRAGLGRWSERIILVLGVAVAAGAFWNHFSPGAWSQWASDSGLVAWVKGVTQQPVKAVIYQRFGGGNYIRAGSIFLAPVEVAYFLLIPVGIVVAHVATGRRKWWQFVVGAACVGGVVFTITRSAILITPVLVLTALLVGQRRVRLTFAALITLALLVPLTGGMYLSGQLSAVVSPNIGNTNAHVTALQKDIEFLGTHPLGTGLGTAGAIAQRFTVAGSFSQESWYFQIGTEIGLLGMLLFTALVVFTLGALWRLARTGDLGATSALCGLVGVALGGFVLHTFGSLSVSVAIFLLAGIATRQAPAAAVAEDQTEVPSRLRRVRFQPDPDHPI